MAQKFIGADSHPVASNNKECNKDLVGVEKDCDEDSKKNNEHDEDDKHCDTDLVAVDDN